MPRSEGWQGQRAAESVCPVQQIDPWYWTIVEASRRMQHPSWPTHRMAYDLVVLCEEYEAAAALAQADADRADAKRAQQSSRAHALSRGHG